MDTDKRVTAALLVLGRVDVFTKKREPHKSWLRGPQPMHNGYIDVVLTNSVI